MKKLTVLALAFATTTVLASEIQFTNLSKSDVENISREFSANFSHTTVSAPETGGLWGVEVGLVAGKTTTPDLKDVVEASGGSGTDVSSIYHAGAMGRVHLPGEIFVELSLLPEQEINGLTIKNTSYEAGWNAGGFFALPVDIAVGMSIANSAMSFKQTTPVVADTSIESKTRIIWMGVSKTFLIVTPYAKLGTVSADSDFSATGTVLNYSADQNESVTNTGGYLAFGANLQLAFLKFGFEVSQIMDVKRASGKFSFDF